VSVNQLRPQLRELAETAQWLAYDWLLDEEPTAEELRDDLALMVGAYVQSAAILAADWYNSEGSDSRYTAIPVDVLPPERLERLSEWVFKGPQRPENRVRVATHAIVFDAARNTVMLNAVNEGVSFARHEPAGSCGHCAQRATHAPKARSSSADDVDREFHHSCEGLFVPVRGALYEPPDHAREWGQKIAEARRAGNISEQDVAKWIEEH
jgi:hypothetical protein